MRENKYKSECQKGNYYLYCFINVFTRHPNFLKRMVILFHKKSKDLTPEK